MTTIGDTARLRRTTFLSADAEAMARFYEQVFGCTRWYDHELAVDARFPPTGLPDGARAHLVMVRAQDPEVGMLGFLQYLDAAPERTPGAAQLRIGDPVLVWNTTDVDALHARAVAAGGRIATPPAEWTVPAREGSGVTRLRMLSLFDPEGHYCEVSQRLEG
jgi:catechol 2,3-dioxygenase-like lactoylglutathione lyase family enzyme